MRASGNGSPEVCAANLLRIVRGEVAYDRVRGVDGTLIDKPNATDEAGLRAKLFCDSARRASLHTAGI